MDTTEEYNGQPLWDDKKPDPLVIRAAELLGSGSVLDLGTGSGRDSLYLVGKGFDVSAVDNDPERMAILQDKNKGLGDKLTLVQSNVTTYGSSQTFDFVVADMILHFLSSEGVASTIKKMQAWTNPGGYNFIAAYSDRNPSGKRPYLFKHNELLDFYKDWEIVSYEEGYTPWFLKPGETEPRRNPANYLLARKPA